MKNNRKNNMSSQVGKVFRFSLIQNIKSKGFIVSTLLMIAFFFLMIPISGSINGQNGMKIDGIDSSKIEKIYIAVDELPGGLTVESEDFKDFKTEYPIYKDADMIVSKGKMESLSKEMKKDAANNIFISFSFDNETGFVIDVRKSEESDLGEIDVESIGENLASYFDKIRYEKCKVTEDQLKLINTPVSFDTTTFEKGDEKEDVGDNTLVQSSLTMLLFVMCIMIFTMAGENIATSLITEKSTRVIEYVLVSVRPLALVTGKILAAIVSVVGQVLTFALAGAASYYIFGKRKGMELDDIAQNLNVSSVTEGMTVPGIILAFIIIVLGICIYTTLASMIGATASKLEQLQETLMIYSMLSVVGAYTAMILLMKPFTGAALDWFILCFPLSAPFITPLFVASGKIGLLAGLLVILIMAVAFVLLAILVSRVFETLILYNGSRVKLKAVFAMARNGSAGVSSAKDDKKALKSKTSDSDENSDEFSKEKGGKESEASKEKEGKASEALKENEGKEGSEDE